MLNNSALGGLGEKNCGLSFLLQVFSWPPAICVQFIDTVPKQFPAQ